MLTPLKYTVIGARGFIGSAVVTHLRTLGAKVAAVDRASDTGNVALGHVIYAAGVTADFRTRPFDTIDAHAGSLASLLSQARFESFLYLSSTRVYQGSSSAREGQALVVDPSDPDQLYNVSKLAGEALCLALPRPEIRIARLSNVFGVGDRSQTFLSALIEEARNGEIVLRSAPDSAKDFIFIEDVARLLPLLRSGRERIYNVASGQNVTFGKILESLTKLSGARSSSAAGGATVAFPPIDTARIRTEFGFRETPFDEALERVWQQLRKDHDRDR